MPLPPPPSFLSFPGEPSASTLSTPTTQVSVPERERSSKRARRSRSPDDERRERRRDRSRNRDGGRDRDRSREGERGREREGGEENRVRRRSKERSRERKEGSRRDWKDRDGENRHRDGENRHGSKKNERDRKRTLGINDDAYYREAQLKRREKKRSRSPSPRLPTDLRPSSVSSNQSSSRAQSSLLPLQPSAAPSSSSTLFYSSTKPDDLNLTNQSLYASTVPRFYRSGYGNVIGLPEGLKITAESGRSGVASSNGKKGLEVGWREGKDRKGGGGTGRYMDLGRKRNGEVDGEGGEGRVLLLPSNVKKGDKQLEGTELPAFISLPKLKPTPSTSLHPSPSNTIDPSHNHDGPAYRSIFASASSPSHSDTSLPSDQDDSPGNALAQGIFGNLPPSVDEPSPASSEGEEEGEAAQTTESLLLSKNVHFSRLTQSDPTNPQHWLDWAKFSSTSGFTPSSFYLDDVPSSTRAREKAKAALLSSTTPTHHSKSTIILSILSKALSTHPSALGRSKPFMLTFLRASAEVESRAKTSERWESVLNHPELGADVGVWREWGGWKMSKQGLSIEEGSVEGWVGEGLERLKKSVEAKGGKQVGHEGRGEKEGVMIYLLLRGARSLWESGYPERALAIFQAQIELTFYPPPQFVNASFSTKLASLEEFWDAEVPRFGETGALGWSSFVTSPSSSSFTPAPSASSSSFSLVPIPSPSSDPDATVEPDPFRRWARHESLTSSLSHLPTRTLTTPDSDPYSLCLFFDISPFLIPISEPDSHPQLIHALFSLLELPFPPPGASTQMAFFSDPFLHNALVDPTPHSVSSTDKGSNAKEGTRSFWPDHLVGKLAMKGKRVLGEGGMEPELVIGLEGEACGIEGVGVGGDVGELFRVKAGQGKKPVKGKGKSKESAAKRKDVQLQDFIRSALEQTRKLSDDPVYSLFALSYERSLDPKSAIKLSKTILSQSRTSLPLWDGYARLERSLSKIPEARKVYATAISVSLADPALREESRSGRGEIWALWRGWVEMEWEQDGELERCERILLEAVEGQAGSLDHLLVPSPFPSSPLTPLQSIQIETFLKTTIATLLLSPSPPLSSSSHLTPSDHALPLIHLLAIHTHLSTSLLPQITSLFQTYLSHPFSSTLSLPTLESLHLLQAFILKRHLSRPKVIFRPADVRSTLEASLRVFPGNVRLLEVYGWTEARMKYQGRVRKTLDEVVLKRDEGKGGGGGVASWVWAIWSELWMIKGRHNEWVVRRLCERALEEGFETRSSILLWQIAIQHEILLGDLKRAKSLFYRAIQACPWSKDLHLLPFDALRPVFSSRELEEIYDLMSERNIRVRAPLEDFLEGWKEDGDTDEEEEKEGDVDGTAIGEEERELIRKFEERKRLMPY